jgi:hypothetical protein
MSGRLGERGGHAGRHRDAQPVPQPRHVLGNRQHHLAGDAHLDQPPVPDQSSTADRQSRSGPHRTGDLVPGERPCCPKQIEQLLGGGGSAFLAQPLEVGLGGGDDTGVEQLLEPVLAEQLGQQRSVQGQRGGLLLGQRHVPS